MKLQMLLRIQPLFSNHQLGLVNFQLHRQPQPQATSNLGVGILGTLKDTP